MAADPTIDPQRLRALFDELSELPADQADRRLASDLAGEPALRQALVRLLARDREAEAAGPLPRHLPAAESPAAAADSPSPSPLPAGSSPLPSEPQRLGRFHVVRRLGQGGMGVVYDAYDEVLDRRVALKLLTGSAHQHAHLLREARALARLQHPNVVPIYEVGEHDGRPFIAMERIDGQPLSDWLASSQATPDETLRLLLPAGRALHAAHEKGVVHRDFKPQNVLVGGDGRVRVVDFGIAALRAATAPPPGVDPAADRPAADPGAAGLLAGTPAFMAPEQLAAGEVSPLCDQFAFAVVVYRALYRQAPFAGDDVAALLGSMRAGALRPPPRRAELPPWLWPLLKRALSPDPADRFPSLEPLLAAIESHLPRDPHDDPQRTRRGRTQLLAAFFACALLLALFAQHQGPRLLLGSHARVVAIAAGLLAVAGLLVAGFWRALSTTAHGRRTVAFLLLMPAALLGHRLLGWRLGTPLSALLATDFFLLGCLFAGGAILLDRWLGLLSALLLLAAGLTVHDGHLGAVLFPLVGPLTVALVLLRTRQR